MKKLAFIAGMALSCALLQPTGDDGLCRQAKVISTVSKLAPLVDFLLDGALGGPWLTLLGALEATTQREILDCTAKSVLDEKAKAISSGNGKMSVSPTAVAAHERALKNFQTWKVQRP